MIVEDDDFPPLRPTLSNPESTVAKGCLLSPAPDQRARDRIVPFPYPDPTSDPPSDSSTLCNLTLYSFKLYLSIQLYYREVVVCLEPRPVFVGLRHIESYMILLVVYLWLV